MLFDGYETEQWYDEFFEAPGAPRAEARLLIEAIQSLPEGEFGRLQESANAALINLGITFNVYSDGAGVERVLPFDIVPRVVQAREWDRVESGLKQRIKALNLFLDDVYHEGRILKDGVVPAELVLGAPSYRRAVQGPRPADGHLVPHHGHRPGARQGRRVLRPGG